MRAEVTLLVRMGQDLTIPKYQPTKPNLASEADAVVAVVEDDEEQKDEENKYGDILYSLGFSS